MTGDDNTENLAPERNEGGGSWKGGVNVTLLTKAEDREGEGGRGVRRRSLVVLNYIQIHPNLVCRLCCGLLTVSNKSSTFHLLSRVIVGFIDPYLQISWSRFYKTKLECICISLTHDFTIHITCSPVVYVPV